MSRSNWNLEVMVHVEGGKPGNNLCGKNLGERQEPNTNSTHMTRQVRE